MQLRRSLARTRHAKTRLRLHFVVIGRPARAQNGLHRSRVVDALVQRRPDQVHADDFAQHQPGLDGVPGSGLQWQQLAEPAFETDRTGSDPWRTDQARWRHLQAGQIEFIDFRRYHRRAGVHCFRQWPGGQIPGEFAGGFDVAHAVLATDGGKADDRRNVVECIEKAVRRQIGNALDAARADPADGTRADDGIERIVRQPVTLPRLVEVNAVVGCAHRDPDAMEGGAAVTLRCAVRCAR
ncbi:hypothetical protein XAC2852_130158 [Xanthomonas citri pv. citri]|nr:hypothetical protein XAC2852_130158 [Xanthomonas citri pv. citri]